MDTSPILLKQMIMKAFPPILRGDDTEITPENFEMAIVNYSKVLSKYLAEEEQPGFNRAFSRRFGQGASAFAGRSV